MGLIKEATKNMPIDYVVFKADNERLTRFIVRFLLENGYLLVIKSVTPRIKSSQELNLKRKQTKFQI
jgi:hypothetical protein